MRIGFVSNVKVLAGAAGLLLALVLVVCMVLPALAAPQQSGVVLGNRYLKRQPGSAGDCNLRPHRRCGIRYRHGGQPGSVWQLQHDRLLLCGGR